MTTQLSNVARVISQAALGVDTPSQRKIRVIVNPHGGARTGERLFDHTMRPVLEASGITFETIKTSYAAHAAELGYSHDVHAWEGVIFVSGDGVVGEFLNGFLRRPDWRAEITHLILGHCPAGTSNALAYGLRTMGPLASLYSALKCRVRPLDAILVTSADNQRMISVCGTGFGVAGDIAANSERFRACAGTWRYCWLKVYSGFLCKRQHAARIRYTTQPIAAVARQIEVVPAEGAEVSSSHASVTGLVLSTPQVSASGTTNTVETATSIQYAVANVPRSAAHDAAIQAHRQRQVAQSQWVSYRVDTSVPTVWQPIKPVPPAFIRRMQSAKKSSPRSSRHQSRATAEEQSSLTRGGSRSGPSPRDSQTSPSPPTYAEPAAVQQVEAALPPMKQSRMTLQPVTPAPTRVQASIAEDAAGMAEPAPAVNPKQLHDAQRLRGRPAAQNYITLTKHLPLPLPARLQRLKHSVVERVHLDAQGRVVQVEELSPRSQAASGASAASSLAAEAAPAGAAVATVSSDGTRTLSGGQASQRRLQRHDTFTEEGLLAGLAPSHQAPSSAGDRPAAAAEPHMCIQVPGQSAASPTAPATSGVPPGPDAHSRPPPIRAATKTPAASAPATESQTLPELLNAPGVEWREEQGKYIAIGALNTAQDGFAVHPSDGSMDLTIAREGNIIDTLRLAVAYMAGLEYHTEMLSYVKATAIIIEPLPRDSAPRCCGIRCARHQPPQLLQSGTGAETGHTDKDIDVHVPALDVGAPVSVAAAPSAKRRHGTQLLRAPVHLAGRSHRGKTGAPKQRGDAASAGQAASGARRAGSPEPQPEANHSTPLLSMSPSGTGYVAGPGEEKECLNVDGEVLTGYGPFVLQVLPALLTAYGEPYDVDVDTMPDTRELDGPADVGMSK